MPTYEYKCSACGHAFEKFHSITAAPIKKCPSCGKSKVSCLLGTRGADLQGSGFYITDYRSDSYKDAAKSDSAGGNARDDRDEVRREGYEGVRRRRAETKSTPAEAKPAAKESKPAPKPAETPSKSAKKK